MSANPYSVSKLAHHPEAIAAFRAGKIPAGPVQIHLMPQNLCNHDCAFCSYRLSNWKNSELFNDREHIAWPLLQQTLREARAMGTRAIELTGGGEPMIYPQVDALLDLIDELGFDLGIVSNGTAITNARADRIWRMEHWKWARISIDAGQRETYEKVRSVGPFHWERAWNAVRSLSAARDARESSEIRVGCGFVVERDNFDQVLDFCAMARDSGADNVRLSLRFGPEGNDYYDPGMLDVAEQQAEQAIAQLNSARFTVHNLITERRRNQESSRQDYEPCYTMRSLCVIGGDANVYTCCTLAFTPSGKMGSLQEESFRSIWTRKAFFDAFRVRERCQVQCLYEARNKAMIDMVDGKLPIHPDPDAIHRNFI